MLCMDYRMQRINSVETRHARLDIQHSVQVCKATIQKDGMNVELSS